MSDFASRIARLSPEKRAILEQRLRPERDRPQPASAEPLAIIGMACRFPGADSLEAFWNLLANGTDAISEVPTDRWSVERYFDRDPAAPGMMTSKWGGFIDGVDRFDAAFFGISPREAVQMDPQQRLVLEVAWHALEHAGQAADRLRGTKVGVFIGAHSQSSDYALLQYERPELMDGFSATGSAHNMLSGRLSYLLDLHGPSLVVDTACSSSLVAAHLACQSVRAGESGMAIVGGVNLILSPMFTVAASRMQMLAADGRCKPFDAAADGFTRAEGCGVLIVKTLADARTDGDRVLAIIRGSAVNQDGRTNGITAPNGLAQQAVIRDALQNAGVDPRQVSYIEAHGTGTALGDPIEFEALAFALGSGPSVPLGAVKANIGHLEGAAGVAGLIKTVLCLLHQRIPPVVHFTQLNPHIALQNTRLVVPTSLGEWNQPGRIAGVSSFGWSGTNAHMVLEEAPIVRDASATPDTREQLIVLSAPTPERLRSVTAQWVQWIGSCDTDAGKNALPAVALAAGLRRSQHDERLAIVADSLNDLRQQLARFNAGESVPSIVAGRARSGQQSIVFVFPGQGSQWLGMGRELYATEPIFRQAIDRCHEALSQDVSWRLVDELHAPAELSRLSEIDVVQPMLFAIEVALAELWRGWGIVPDAIVGHSMGEIAAAYVAGALTLADAARVITRRSRLLKTISGRGAMASVELSMAEAEEAIRGYEGRLSIAVSNSARSTVISGEPTAVDQVMATLQRRGVFCRAVKVDVASHSPQVDPLTADLFTALDGVRPQAGRIRQWSTVTGAPIEGPDLGAPYWVQNLRRPVRFSQAIRGLAAEGHTIFIEMSPNPILLPAIEDGFQHDGIEAITIASLRRDEGERRNLLLASALLYVAGRPIDWARQTGPASVVDVPLTPFDRERHWLPAPTGPTRVPRVGHPFLGPSTSAPSGTMVWTADEDAAALSGWRVDGVRAVAPGVLVDSALEAASAVGAGIVADLEFQRLLPVVAAAAWTTTAAATREADGEYAFTIQRQRATALTTHVTGRLCHRADVETVEAIDIAAVVEYGLTLIPGPAVYDRIATAGLDLGQRFQVIIELRVGDRQVAARFQVPQPDHAAWRSSAVVAQACFDAAAVSASIWTESAATDLWQPFRLAGIEAVGRLTGQSDRSGWIVVTRSDGSTGKTEQALVQVAVCGEDGSTRLLMRDVMLQCHSSESRSLLTQPLEDWCCAIEWEEAPIPVSPVSSARGRWIILADGTGVGSALARHIDRQGGEALLFYRDQADGLDWRLRDALVPPARGIVDLWSLDLPKIESAAPEQFEGDLVTTTESVVQAVRALASLPVASAARLWIATSGAQPVDGSLDAGGPLQATMWGLGRVVGEEHPDLWGGLFDLDPRQQPETAAEELLQGLLQERPDRQVGYRNGRCYLARFIPAGDRDSQRLTLRSDGAYLISGGLNGVGLAVARWMIKQGARRLILVNRTPLPSRERWLELDASSVEGRRVSAIREFEGLGATIHAPAIDVADEQAVQTFFDQYRREGHPPLRGIVHAAVVVNDGLLRNVDASAFATVLRPKVSGTRVLHRLANTSQVDFFVMFSSLGSMLGQTGQANYAAANAFLDAMAYYRRGRGLPAVTINWCGWREAGLGAASAGARRTIATLESDGIGSCSTAQGLDLFANLVAGGRPQTVVMPMNRSRFARSHWAAADPLLFSRVIAAPTAAAIVAALPSPSVVNRLRALDPSSRRPLFEQFLIERLAEVLRLPVARIDSSTPMGSLGLGSLIALELRNKLQTELGLTLSATVAWNYPTVTALAEYLSARLQIPFEHPEAPSELDGASMRATADVIGSSSIVDELSDEDAWRALRGEVPAR